jgi:hypothetical protein
MLKKLVTSLASLKSRHLEESELGGRGNHAVGEFVCAEGSVSKVKEINLVLPLHQAVPRFVAIPGNCRNTIQARKESKELLHRANSQSLLDSRYSFHKEYSIMAQRIIYFP